MPVKGREGSCWGFTLPHLKIFWRSQFSSVLSCHKLSVTSLAINPSMHSACKTEDILHRQLGAEMTAVSRLQQPSNLEPLPGCKQHRESRAIHHWASDSFSKTTNMHPHLPFGFPRAVSPGEIFLKVTLSGTSVLDHEQSHMGTQPMWAHRSSEQPPTKAALFSVLAELQLPCFYPNQCQQLLRDFWCPLVLFFTDYTTPVWKRYRECV